MTYFSPNTCLCVSHVESETLLIKCNRHNNFNQMLAENQAENKRFGLDPNETQKQEIAENRKALRETSTRNKSKFLRLQKIINDPKSNKKLDSDLRAKRRVNI